uniref:Transmembrane protein n=1 Tax=Heterorhabditis bacteriophora TaxID=37862 RepID=A0A1I7WFN3_HETBA
MIRISILTNKLLNYEINTYLVLCSFFFFLLYFLKNFKIIISLIKKSFSQPPPHPLLFKAPRSGYNSAPPPLYAGQYHRDDRVDFPTSTFNGYIQSSPEINEIRNKAVILEEISTTKLEPKTSSEKTNLIFECKNMLPLQFLILIGSSSLSDAFYSSIISASSCSCSSNGRDEKKSCRIVFWTNPGNVWYWDFAWVSIFYNYIIRKYTIKLLFLLILKLLLKFLSKRFVKFAIFITIQINFSITYE